MLVLLQLVLIKKTCKSNENIISCFNSGKVYYSILLRLSTSKRPTVRSFSSSLHQSSVFGYLKLLKATTKEVLIILNLQILFFYFQRLLKVYRYIFWNVKNKVFSTWWPLKRSAWYQQVIIACTRIHYHLK